MCTFAHTAPAVRQNSSTKPEISSPVQVWRNPRVQSALPIRRALGNRAVRRMLQPKLRIATSGDEYEQEADRVAAQVMRMPDPHAKHSCTCGRSSTRPAHDLDCCTPKPTQTVARSLAGTSSITTPATVERLSHGKLMQGGSTLQPGIRKFFESRFGQDFSPVRVHTGPESHALNGALNSRAFTYGSHIWLANDHAAEPSPLMAHELAHVVQQSASGLAVQRQPAPTSDQNYTGEEAIQERLAELEDDREAIGVDLVRAQTKNPGQADPLQAELTVVEREILMVERLHEAGMRSTEPDGPPWNRSERDVARLIDKARAAARTEKATLSFLQAEDLRAGRIVVGAVTSTLLERPELFRATTLELYRRVTAEFVRRRNEHTAKYEGAVNGLATRPIKEVIGDYVRMRKHWFTLEGQIRRVNWDVELQPFSPELRQRTPGSADVVVDQLEVLVRTRNIDRTLAGVVRQLGNLQAPLADWHLASSYDAIVATMQRFSVAFETGAPPGVPIAAYQGNLPADLRQATRMEVGSTSGFLFDVGRVLRRRLDAWVNGLAWHERIIEGFWMYDLGGKTGAQLKRMLTWESLVVIVGFIAFLIGIQAIPFANLVVDAILLATAGLDLLKGIYIFGKYFDAASDADTFEKLYAAVEGLQGAEEAVVNLMVSLTGFALSGALKGYGSYRKQVKVNSLDALAKEPVVRDVPAIRKAVEDAKKARKEAADLKKTAPGKWSPEPGILKTAKTKDGQHTVKATESGRLVVCSVCDDAANRYAGQLEADAKAGGTAKTELKQIDDNLQAAIARRDDLAVEKALQDLVNLEERLRSQRRKILEPTGRRPHEADAGLHLEDLLGEQVNFLDEATKARLGKDGDFIHPRTGRTYDAVSAIGPRLNTTKEWADFTASVKWHMYSKHGVDRTFIDAISLNLTQLKQAKDVVAQLVKANGPPRAPVIWFPKQ